MVACVESRRPMPDSSYEGVAANWLMLPVVPGALKTPLMNPASLPGVEGAVGVAALSAAAALLLVCACAERLRQAKAIAIAKGWVVGVRIFVALY